MAETSSPAVPIACPAPGCGYEPPRKLSEAGQIKALERHVSLSHTLSDFPAVVDALKAGEVNITAGEPQLETPTEPEQEPPAQPEQEPQPEQPAQPASKPQEATEGKRQTVGVQERPAKVDKPKSGLADILPMGNMADDKKERINARAAKWGEYLYKDFNPLLVSTVSTFAGIPEPWLDGGPNNGQPVALATPDGKQLVFWDPPLRERLTLTEGDCKKIAKAGAHFSESPMGQVLTAWLESNSHYIAVALALYVAGKYGWNAMKIKAEVGQLKEVMEAQARMAQPQAAENPAA